MDRAPHGVCTGGGSDAGSSTPLDANSLAAASTRPSSTAALVIIASGQIAIVANVAPAAAAAARPPLAHLRWPPDLPGLDNDVLDLQTAGGYDLFRAAAPPRRFSQTRPYFGREPTSSTSVPGGDHVIARAARSPL